MSVSSDKGNDEPLVRFDDLDVDDNGDKKGAKLQAMLKILKEKLSPEDFKEVTATLGIKTELSNEELLEAILAKLKEKEDKDDDEYEYPKPKTTKGADPNYKQWMQSCVKGGKTEEECAEEFKKKYPAPKEEEKAEVAKLMPGWIKELEGLELDLSYKSFISKCMKGGKDLKECAAEWKKKHPEKKPTEAEIAEVEEMAKKLKADEDALPEEVRNKLSAQETRIVALEERARLAELGREVDSLVHDQHISPKQKDHVIKLSARMTPDMKDEFFNLFRTTQKYNVTEDAGKMATRRPGDPGMEIDEETRKLILDKHGLADLIADKGVRRKNN